MADKIEIVHVSFGPSRSESIRDAIAIKDRGVRVLALPGALNYGPIDPPDPNVRLKWIKTVLRPNSFDDRPEPTAP